MGEESDGDANLIEDDSDTDSEPESAEEVDEPTAESDPESDEPENPDADDSDAPASDEPSASPPEATAEDGGTSSSSEPPAVEPEDEESEDEESSDDDSDGSEDNDDSDDESGNLQRVERPDVSLSPDQLTTDEESKMAPEPPRRPDAHMPPAESEQPAEPETPEDESAPLAEDVSTPDSLEEAAQRSEPLEDEEMPLADHIEEMLKRLAVVLVIAGVVSLAVLPVSETVINFLWNSVLPAGEGTRPRLYGPLALVFTKLKVASLAGLIVALPVFVYETYLFMRPGLYPHERRYYLAAVPTSLVLAFVGISFAYFLVLPVIFEYFLYYSQDVTTIAFALTKTFNLILLMMGYLAIVFQIPLFIMLAIMMGLTTRRWLEQRRLYFWAAFLGISFMFSFDPTGMAPIMVAATMVVLFEGTLVLLRWTGR